MHRRSPRPVLAPGGNTNQCASRFVRPRRICVFKKIKNVSRTIQSRAPRTPGAAVFPQTSINQTMEKKKVNELGPAPPLKRKRAAPCQMASATVLGPCIPYT
jgi:hypothetical protein